MKQEKIDEMLRDLEAQKQKTDKSFERLKDLTEKPIEIPPEKINPLMITAVVLASVGLVGYGFWRWHSRQKEKSETSQMISR